MTPSDSSQNSRPSDLGELFGFELKDDSWFARIRETSAGFVPSTGRLGEYELLGDTRRGGQGVVFRARQPRTGREVALKRLAAGVFATTEMRARFARETEVIARLDHPNIVTVYGSEVIEDQPVLAMQWIEGAPFDEW